MRNTVRARSDWPLSMSRVASAVGAEGLGRRGSAEALLFTPSDSHWLGCNCFVDNF